MVRFHLKKVKLQEYGVKTNTFVKKLPTVLKYILHVVKKNHDMKGFQNSSEGVEALRFFTFAGKKESHTCLPLTNNILGIPTVPIVPRGMRRVQSPTDHLHFF